MFQSENEAKGLSEKFGVSFKGFNLYMRFELLRISHFGAKIFLCLSLFIGTHSQFQRLHLSYTSFPPVS